MRPKKDGIFLNCYVDRTLNETLTTLSEILGITKTSLLERGLQMLLGPYMDHDENGKEVFRPRKAFCHMDAHEKKDTADPMAMPEFRSAHAEEEPCYVLAEVERIGKPYYKIIKDGILYFIPKDQVRLVDTDE